MGTLIRFLIVGVAAASAVGSAWWYLKVYQPKADLVSNETTQSFIDRASLQGTESNTAEVQDVTIDADGTIRLAPAP